MTKKSRQKLKYLESKKSFLDEIKSILKGPSVAKNCFRPESPHLNHQNFKQNFKIKVKL